MEQLTLEQAAIKYDTDHFNYPTPGENVLIPEITASQWNVDAFKAGAEWQKEQLKAHMQKVISAVENEFAKQLVENVTAILFS